MSTSAQQNEDHQLAQELEEGAAVLEVLETTPDDPRAAQRPKIVQVLRIAATRLQEKDQLASELEAGAVVVEAQHTRPYLKPKDPRIIGRLKTIPEVMQQAAAHLTAIAA